MHRLYLQITTADKTSKIRNSKGSDVACLSSAPHYATPREGIKPNAVIRRYSSGMPGWLEARLPQNP